MAIAIAPPVTPPIRGRILVSPGEGWTVMLRGTVRTRDPLVPVIETV